MTARAIAAWGLLVVLGLCQIAALAGPFALLLTAPGAPSVAGLLAAMVRVINPTAISLSVSMAIIFGTAAALALWRLRSWGVAAGFLLAPLLMSTALFVQGRDSGHAAVLLAGFASQGLAFGTACGLISLRGVDAGVLRAAACCGVSPVAAVWRVLLPLMAPGILGGALLAALAAVATGLGLLSRSLPAGSVLPMQATPLWIAAGGLSLLLCALTALALALLRRP